MRKPNKMKWIWVQERFFKQDTKVNIMLIDKPTKNCAIKKKQTYFESTDAKIQNKILENRLKQLIKRIYNATTSDLFNEKTVQFQEVYMNSPY